MSPNKIIIMAAPPQPPMGGPPEDFGPPGPISAAEVRILHLLLQIQHGLGRMEEAIGSLKAATDRHRTDIDGLGARHNNDLSELRKEINEVGRRLERDLNETGKRLERDLNETGRRLERAIGNSARKIDTADKLFRIFLGALVVIVTVFGPPLIIYLYHHLTFHP